MAARVFQEPQNHVDKEGFLCPICVQDLGSANVLAYHFDSVHNDQSSDVLEHVKGFFGKAKKFFNLDQEDVSFPNSDSDLQSLDTDRPRSRSLRLSQIQMTNQEPGKKRNMTDWFKALRDAQVDRNVIETNKLLIRMSKLTTDDSPDDGPKRRAFEQQIVPWQSDKTAKTCTKCGKSFNITRRRHHCRLCGGIMCDSCSEFLPFTQAKLLGSIAANPEISIGPKLFLQRRGSNSSLNSIGSTETGPTLRICASCRKLLETHKLKQEQRHFKPEILSLYEKLQEFKSKVESIIPDYTKMALSLRSGETSCSLNRAEELRLHIAKLCNNMDTISKRITALGSNSEEQVTDRQAKILINVRAHVIAYVQEITFELPNLPDEKELKHLISQREEERKRKVAKELKEAQLRDHHHHVVLCKTAASPTLAPPLPTVNRESVGSEGWTPHDVDGKHVADDDPMVQQMNIIKGYMKQATQAQKWDEVEMLEANLKHLEEEYYRQIDLQK